MPEKGPDKHIEHKSDWIDLLQRARWDRIGGAFAVLIVILILLSSVTSCLSAATESNYEDSLISQSEDTSSAEHMDNELLHSLLTMQ